MKYLIQFILIALGISCCISMLASCGNKSPHRGIFPFSAMEQPQSHRTANRRAHRTMQTPKRMSEITRYDARAVTNDSDLSYAKRQIQAGDVIAFYMDHQQARKYLRAGAIQKIPYELFRFGHVALIVPDPEKPISSHGRADLRILQVAMKQAINTAAGLDYLDDKSWIIFRPPRGFLDLEKLHNFTQLIIKKGQSPQKAYHYTAALGLWNGKIHPITESQISDEYTCTTLIVAALNYSGYHLFAQRRGGVLDLITPSQVVTSWGIQNR